MPPKKQATLRRLNQTTRPKLIHRKWAHIGVLYRTNMHTALRSAMQRARAHNAQLISAMEDGKSTKLLRAPGGANVVTSMSDEAALAAVPYWQQGDLELYSEDNLQKRLELRHNKQVVDELQVWWCTAQRSMQSGGDSTASELDREHYMVMCVRIYKAMMEDFDLAEAEKNAADDWENDCAPGEQGLGRERFMDAIFELADVWTKSVDPSEYVDFLRTLFQRVARGAPPDQARSPSQTLPPTPAHGRAGPTAVLYAQPHCRPGARPSSMRASLCPTHMRASLCRAVLLEIARGDQMGWLPGRGG